MKSIRLLNCTTLVGLSVVSSHMHAGNDVAAVRLGPEQDFVLVVRSSEPVSWLAGERLGSEMGGRLFTPRTPAESAEIQAMATELGPWDCLGPWIGVRRNPSNDPLSTGWLDSAGLPLKYTDWSRTSPEGAQVLEWAAALHADVNGETAGWANVLPDPAAGWAVHGWVFRLPGSLADCDEDNVPDIAEIILLDAADIDEDGVPDQCSGPSADFNGDGYVDGADFGLLLAAWGNCAPDTPCPEDLDGNGTVNGSDIGLLLAQWFTD